MLDMKFLTQEQVYGNKKIDVIKHYGTKCAITDFSILLGGYVDDYNYVENEDLKNLTGWWWTSTFLDNKEVIISNIDGVRNCALVSVRVGGSRPVLSYSQIKSSCSNENHIDDNIREVEYGEYPQTIVDEELSSELEKILHFGSLKKTGKIYTVDSNKYYFYNKEFESKSIIEYEYNGEKFVRILENTSGTEKKLSDGREIEEGTFYWVKVEPIKWLIDEKEDIALSEKILFSGIQFKNEKDYDKNFDKTNIKKFMDDYFSKEIEVEMSKEIVEEPKDKLNIINPYNFNFDKVSEEEIIRGAVKSNIAVFLHGKSSDGKSARVKQIDPELEIIYLRNATPDSLNGKSVYNSQTGEIIDIKPTWLKRLEEKCAKEKNKIHILFLDEITNALPSIQGMAFNIVLDKEVNGIWKLSENARIVAAGNDLNDSLAANKLAEPLFNRFAHVYINTTTESWLKWASTPKEEYQRLDYEINQDYPKIHPAIYAFIAYNEKQKKSVLRTKYTGETPNADPRKWEMASKILYTTRNPEMLKALVGGEITKEFVAFCQSRIISVDDVINNRVPENVEMNMAEKFLTAVGLSVVDEENLELVRNFVKELGPEVLTTFDSMWINGDNKRLEIIAGIKLNEMAKTKKLNKIFEI